VYSEKTDFVDYIYPIELEINENMGTDSSVSYIDLHLVIGNKSGLRTNLHSKQWTCVSESIGLKNSATQFL
jgi:hypothetical protein